MLFPHKKEWNMNKRPKEQKDRILTKMKSPTSKKPLAENSGKIRKKKEEDQEFKLNNSISTQNESKGRRYPKRQVSIKNYKEIDEPQEDRYVFCDFCQESFLDCCSKCGQLAFLQDTVVEMGVENRAKLTLPSNFVQIMPSKIHGLGVFANVVLKKGIKMGPYQGITTRVESTSGYSWKLRDGFLVDAGDEKNSNWMRYVNCARHFKEQNLMAFQYKGELYYRTCQDIQPGQEMLVYYGNHFAKNLGIDVKSYFKPKEDNVVEDGRYCQFCRIGYRDSSRLDNHIILCKLNPANFKKPPDKIFTCRFCGIGITDETYFEKHEKRCEKQSKRNKENINRQNIKIVKANIERKYKESAVELNEKKFKCYKCAYTTQRASHLERHEMIHSEKLLFICSVCQKGFNERNSLQCHMYKHLNNSNDIQLIDVQKIFDNYGTKKTVMALILGSYYKITFFECEKCKYISTNTDNLKRHINNKHTRTFTFKCHLCSYVCLCKESIKLHLNKIHFQNLKRKCEKCDYKTNSIDQLKYHVKKVHLKIKDYKCGICNFETFYKFGLKKHILYVHLNIRKFKCEFCSYSATMKSTLNKHLNAIHLKTIKYQCDVCSYFSYQKWSLTNHIKKKHLS